ncbi:A-kinase-interacting protein 1 [Gastrophryne carolinensis]
MERLEESLRRSSELAKEVLERAKRREVDWWPSHRLEGPGSRIQLGTEEEDDGGRVALQEAFTMMSHFLRHTTKQCQSSQSDPLRLPPVEDVCIEVAPGTYRISAASTDRQPQTHIVHMVPGQSVALTFSI